MTRQLDNSRTQTLSEGRFDWTLKRQTGSPGMYARVMGHLEPCDELFVFEDRVTNGTIPSQFIKACEQGFREATGCGVLAGYPVIGVKVVLEGGGYHEVDSNDRAFRFCAYQAFHQGMRSANPAIVEPVMQVEAIVPMEFVGAVQADFLSRRGVLTGLDGEGVMIRGEAPLAELFGYATRLRSLTSGRGQFSMSFCRYQTVSESLQQQLVEAKLASCS